MASPQSATANLKLEPKQYIVWKDQLWYVFDVTKYKNLNDALDEPTDMALIENAMTDECMWVTIKEMKEVKIVRDSSS